MDVEGNTADPPGPAIFFKMLTINDRLGMTTNLVTAPRLLKAFHQIDPHLLGF